MLLGIIVPPSARSGGSQLKRLTRPGCVSGVSVRSDDRRLQSSTRVLLESLPRKVRKSSNRFDTKHHGYFSNNQVWFKVSSEQTTKARELGLPCGFIASAVDSLRLDGVTTVESPLRTLTEMTSQKKLQWAALTRTMHAVEFVFQSAATTNIAKSTPADLNG